jgi:hypothetical protein
MKMAPVIDALMMMFFIGIICLSLCAGRLVSDQQKTRKAFNLCDALGGEAVNAVVRHQ